MADSVDERAAEARRLDEIAGEYRRIVARTVLVRDACIVVPAAIALPVLAFVGPTLPTWAAYVGIPLFLPMPLVALLVQVRRSPALAAAQDAIVAAHRQRLFDRLAGAPIHSGTHIAKFVLDLQKDRLDVRRIGSASSIERDKVILFYLGLITLVCSLVVLVTYGPSLSGLVTPSLHRTVGFAILSFIGLGCLIAASLD